jgi:uncharacterized membrane protein
MELFQPKWRFTMIRLWGLWCAMVFGYYGTILTISRIFQKQVSDKDDNDNDNDTQQNVKFDFSALLTSKCSIDVFQTIIEPTLSF